MTLTYREWIPHKLKALRRQHGLTLKTVAALSSLSVGYLGDIEKGRTVPTLATLEVLMGVYGLTLVLSFKVKEE